MAVVDTLSKGVSASQTPRQGAALSERMNSALLKIIRENFNTQYVAQAASLARFRDAISVHGTEIDTTLLADFRAHVPLSKYDSYKPFVDKFFAKPCKEEEVENMFSPGLPAYLALSSGTTGTIPNILPKYNRSAGLKPPPRRQVDPNSNGPLAIVVYTGYIDVKEVEHTSGEVIQRIPVCSLSGGTLRRAVGWYTDDESRMSLTFPGFVVPWAATVIAHLPSFLIVHSLFLLARRDVGRFCAAFATQLLDLVRYIDEQWDVLVSCIRDGTLPDLEDIDHVREYLQAQFHADPERAAELLEIGPPFSIEGWFSLVWPKARELLTICSGQFATVLPTIRSILGPNIQVFSPGYGASEAAIGIPHDANKLDEFILQNDDIVEFLDVSQDESHENLRQAWEVEVGKRYELVVTTGDGLWRYRLGDVVYIVGFHTEGISPVFKFSGRRKFMIRLQSARIRDDQLIAAILTCSSEDAVQVQEFTTVLDNRMLLPTVGFFVELAGPLGANAHLAPQRLFDALAATNAELQYQLEQEQIRLPSIRIVKAGTFTEYREWKRGMASVGSGQIKVPVVLLDATAEEWISERVVHEL